MTCKSVSSQGGWTRRRAEIFCKILFVFIPEMYSFVEGLHKTAIGLVCLALYRGCLSRGMAGRGLHGSGWQESNLRCMTGKWNHSSTFCTFVEGPRYSWSLKGWWGLRISVVTSHLSLGSPCDLQAGPASWTWGTPTGSNVFTPSRFLLT